MSRILVACSSAGWLPWSAPAHCTRAHIYTAATFPVTPETHKVIDAEKLAGELEVDMCAVNSGRHWMHDEYYYIGSEVVNFHGVEMRWVGEMTSCGGDGPVRARCTPPP